MCELGHFRRGPVQLDQTFELPERYKALDINTFELKLGRILKTRDVVVPPS
jgi:hypothetical protein